MHFSTYKIIFLKHVTHIHLLLFFFFFLVNMLNLYANKLHIHFIYFTSFSSYTFPIIISLTQRLYFARIKLNINKLFVFYNTTTKLLYIIPFSSNVPCQWIYQSILLFLTISLDNSKFKLYILSARNLLKFINKITRASPLNLTTFLG